MKRKKIPDELYRLIAQLSMMGVGAVELTAARRVTVMEVSETAAVHPTYGGAFVEVEVWVPDVAVNKVTDSIREKVFSVLDRKEGHEARQGQ